MRELKKLLTRGCRRLGVDATPRNAAILAAATMGGDTPTREMFTDAPDDAGLAPSGSAVPPTSIDPKEITAQVRACLHVMVPVAVDEYVAERVPVEVAKEIAAALPHHAIDPEAITAQVQVCVDAMVPTAVDAHAAKGIPPEIMEGITASLRGVVDAVVAESLDKALGNPPAQD